MAPREKVEQWPEDETPRASAQQLRVMALCARHNLALRERPMWIASGENRTRYLDAWMIQRPPDGPFVFGDGEAATLADCERFLEDYVDEDAEKRRIEKQVYRIFLGAAARAAADRRAADAFVAKIAREHSDEERL